MAHSSAATTTVATATTVLPLVWARPLVMKQRTAFTAARTPSDTHHHYHRPSTVYLSTQVWAGAMWQNKGRTGRVRVRGFWLQGGVLGKPNVHTTRQRERCDSDGFGRAQTLPQPAAQHALRWHSQTSFLFQREFFQREWVDA
jgi:hypothetical protein